MASITDPEEQGGIWHELKELDFLNWFFSWFFLLLTQLSEPLMLLSTLYVIAETGVHAISSPAIHALAVGIMITAPEILLPGAFVKAAKTREQGGRFSGLLYVMCWTFVGLTLLTLADLFIWHLSGTPLNMLMYVRCAAAVGYSILMRVMSHGHGQVLQVAVPDVLAQIGTLSEQVHQLNTSSKQIISETEHCVAIIIAQALQGFSEQMEQTFTVTVQDVTEQVGTHVSEQGKSNTQAIIQALSEQAASLTVKQGTTPREHHSEQRKPAQSEQQKTALSDKRQAVHEYLRSNPDATVTSIVNSVGVSRGYASQQRSQFMSEHQSPTEIIPAVKSSEQEKVNSN